jgi:hypothetical protein
MAPFEGAPSGYYREKVRTREKDSLGLDVHEAVRSDLTCIYDFKTGQRVLAHREDEIMTTIKDVRDAVRPLIQRRNDLISTGRFVFIKPVQHLLRGVHIDRCSDPDVFVPKFSVRLLAPRHEISSPGWCPRFRQANYCEYIREAGWNITKPETIAQMLDMIEEALPQLYAIESLDDYFAYLSGLPMPWVSSSTIERFEALIPVIKGEFDIAVRLLQENRTVLEYFNYLSPEFYPALLAEDRVRITRILHEWEATSVKTYKIEKIWKRTPFPLELLGG